MNIRGKTLLSKQKSKPTQVEVQNIVSEHISRLRQAFNKKIVDQIAWETEFIKRTSYKVGGKDFLVALLLASLDTAHTSLERISSFLTLVNRNLRIAAQSIMERINSFEGVQFFLRVHELVLKNRVLEWSKSVPPILFAHFSKVLIQDSTTFELNEHLQEHFKGSGGRSSKSCAKIDVVYDLLAKRYEKFTLTDQRETDSTLAWTIEDVVTENSLVIRDLGYLQVDALEKIVEKKAYYLSRVKASFQIFLEPNSAIPIDIADCFTDDTNVIDIPVFVTKARFPTRLIAYRAPEEVVNKRKRLAHATANKQGRTVGKKNLKMMEFTVFMTNVPHKYWVSEVVGTIYGIRWQIEILFKNWKSGIGIHYLRGINPNRIRVLLYARMILLMLINNIYHLASWLSIKVGRNVSMYKVFLWLRDPECLLRIIKGTMKTWERKYFLDRVLKSMCQQKRKRKTTLESICEGIFYDKYYKLA